MSASSTDRPVILARFVCTAESLAVQAKNFNDVYKPDNANLNQAICLAEQTERALRRAYADIVGGNPAEHAS